jgi:hypothetical protein
MDINASENSKNGDSDDSNCWRLPGTPTACSVFVLYLTIQGAFQNICITSNDVTIIKSWSGKFWKEAVLA